MMFVLISEQSIGQNDDCHLVDDCSEIDWIVEFDFGEELNATAGVEVCIPVIVNNFYEVVSFEFSMSFDPSILQFSQKLDPQNLPTFDPATSCTTNLANEGILNVLYFNQNLTGVCLDDGTEIFSLCFIPVGDPGTCSPITITGSAVDPLVEGSITDESFATAQYCRLEFEADPGTICIGCNDLNINTGFCSTSTGTNLGSIFFEFCGGTGPYDWTANGQSGTANEGELVTINNLGTGMYTVNVTDAAGTMLSETIQILNQPAMEINLLAKDPTCVGRDDGEISLTVADGFEPYFEAWSNFEFETDLIDDLGPGTYSVTVTDGLGCQQVATTTIEIDTLKVMATLLDSATCPGATDGIIEITASGGIPIGGTDYEFITPSGSFNSGSPFVDNNVTDGWYFYQVEDSAIPNCSTGIDSIWVEPKTSIIADIEVDSVLCYGECNGFVRVTPSQGSGNYLFLLQDSDFNLIFGGVNIGNMIFENPSLCAGDYLMYITDQTYGCQIIEPFTIYEPDTLIMNEMVNLPSCSGGDGSILLDGTGGTMPYTFLWDDNDTSNEKTNLGGGEYCATITDANGCQDSICVMLVQGGMLETNAGIIETIACPGSLNGKINVQLLSGSGNYNYMWYNDDDVLISNQQTVCDLGAGLYYVIVEDLVQNCTSEPDTVILAPGIDLEITPSATSPSCPGLSDGVAAVTVMGGSGNPTYLWDTLNNVTNTLFSVPAGEYCVTINDGACTETVCVTVDDPPSITIDIKDIDPVMCFGDSTGSVTIQAIGGTVNSGSYFYTIFDQNMVDLGGASGDCVMIGDIPSGNLFAFASDGQCPSQLVPFTLNAATRIEIDTDASVIDDPSCYGLCNGSATVQAMGGTGPYTYFWPDYGLSGPTVTDICPGTQYVEITDAFMCTVLDSISLSQPDSIEVSINTNQTTGITCFGEATGMLAIFHSGGNEGSFTYTWSPNVSDDLIATNISAGLYEITVTDSEGCTDSISYIFENPSELVADFPLPEEPLCFGGETCISVDNVSGGAGNYSFAINGSTNIPIDSCISVIADQYTVSVFDIAGCSVDTTYIINQPFELDVDLGPEVIEADLGDSTETLQAIINSFLPIDTIIWDSQGNYDCFTIDCDIINIYPTSTQEYMVTVIDENGCTDSDIVIVTIDENRNVYFPNIFSPNNDGQNDLFQIFAGDGVEMIDYFYVYDRWGNLMWGEENVIPEVAGTVGWDGNFKGSPVNPGIYVYVAQVSFLDGRKIVYSRDLTLMR